MTDYISREAFLAEKRHLYCENCARRKGMKNGKIQFIYEIGDAPCRACDIGDVLDEYDARRHDEEDLRFVRFLYNVIQPNEMEQYMAMYRAHNDPNCVPNCGADMREES